MHRERTASPTDHEVSTTLNRHHDQPMKSGDNNNDVKHPKAAEISDAENDDNVSEDHIVDYVDDDDDDALHISGESYDADVDSFLNLSLSSLPELQNVSFIFNFDRDLNSIL